jgi:hypothetical protein
LRRNKRKTRQIKENLEPLAREKSESKTKRSQITKKVPPAVSLLSQMRQRSPNHKKQLQQRKSPKRQLLKRKKSLISKIYYTSTDRFWSEISGNLTWRREMMQRKFRRK